MDIPNDTSPSPLPLGRERVGDYGEEYRNLQGQVEGHIAAHYPAHDDIYTYSDLKLSLERANEAKKNEARMFRALLEHDVEKKMGLSQITMLEFV